MGSGDVDTADPIPLLLVAAALSRALADALDRLDDPAVDEDARVAVRRLADRLEETLTARRRPQ